MSQQGDRTERLNKKVTQTLIGRTSMQTERCCTRNRLPRHRIFMRLVKLALLGVLVCGPMMWDGTSVSQDFPCDFSDGSKPCLQGEDNLQVGLGVVICTR